MRKKTSAELKAMAKKRMAPVIASLVGSVVIFGAILIVLAIAMSVIVTGDLLSQGVFNSEDAMEKYIMDMMTKTPTFIESLKSYGFEMLIGALLATLTAGLSFVALKAARQEEVKISDMFKVYKMNPDRIIIIYIIGYLIKFLFSLPSMMLTYVTPGDSEVVSIAAAATFLLDMVGIICQIAVTVLLSQAYFIYLDNPEQNSLVSALQSMDLMRNNFFGFLYLMLSFIPWYFVIAFTFGIASIWIVPYQNVTLALYYMDLKGELTPHFDQVA